ncbi:MAG: LysM domain-containing protein [Gemmatimonadales bacterium]|nr:MAG: LysM domain-containing protein [Gemmatimonadales bacterium]
MRRLCSRLVRLAPCLALAALPVTALAQAVPETHTVREGDTLWDLAGRYFGDPLLWPEIYRQNTMVVEDPHWIYPGEVLRLSGTAAVSAIPDVGPSGQVVDAVDMADVQARGDTERGALESALFQRRSRLNPDQASLAAYQTRPPKPLSASEFYSSGFLTEGRSLPFGKLVGPVTPKEIGATRMPESAQIFSEILVDPPSGGAYQIGDSLLIVSLARDVGGYGRIAIPAGMARVTAIDGERNIAEVVGVYGDIRAGQRILLVEPFPDPGMVRPVAVEDGIRARFLASRDNQIMKGPLDVVFLDQGRQDGVALGDIYELHATPANRGGVESNVDEELATVRVVHVGDRSATARVVSVNAPDIAEGTPARQIAKLPS